jgi:exodeoxyribonuclease VII small subunit
MMATAKSEKNTKKTQDISFEQGLARLDEIISVLEKDNVALDDLMKLYEEGVGLLRACNEQLDTAEQKVKMLKISPDGLKANLVPFDGESDI